MRFTSLLLTVLFIASLQNINAQKETTQKFLPAVESIMIYLNGAEITHNIPIKLSAGRNSLVFEGISPKLVNNSIRVSLEDNISVLAISSTMNYLTKQQDKPRIKQLKDSLKLVNNKIRALKDEDESYTTEKDLLVKNMQLGGANNGVNINDLKIAADFYRNRIGDIDARRSAIAQKLEDLDGNAACLTSALEELNAKTNFERAEISVLVSSEREMTSHLELKYLLTDAGWTPSYDIKTEDIDKPIDLVYRAKVFNNTSIDWNNVKIKLSTGDPNLTATKPELKPWYLNFGSLGLFSNVSNNWSNAKAQGFIQQLNNQQQAVSQDQEYKTRDKQQQADFELQEVEVTQLSTEFEIKDPYTIPADNKPYLVDVVKYQLPAAYKHFAIPKLDKDVFLLAQITGWEDLNLVQGPANIYFNGSYIGESYIQTNNVKDTLDISLGRDKKVVVTRVKQKDYKSAQFMGSKRKETLAYQMVVKNNRKAAVNIEIIDQLPISQNSEIEVETLDISNAAYNNTSGECKWKFVIQPDKNEIIKLAFAIKYPKNSTIQVEEQRKVMMREYKK
jgi:uncharacterized protein (TIGR02231 family)